MTTKENLALLLSLCLLCLSSSGCTVPSTPAPTITPTPQPTFTPLPAATPLPTPTPAPDTILDEAGPLCDQAFVSEITGGEISAPVLGLMLNTGLQKWFSHPIAHVSARSAEDIHTLVCIIETRENVGTYSDGSTAYRITWDVRFVSFPDGKVLAGQSWLGAAPAQFISSNSSRTGHLPDRRMLGWLNSQVRFPSVLVFEDYQSRSFAPISDWGLLAVVTEKSRFETWDTVSWKVQDKFETNRIYGITIESQLISEWVASPVRAEIAFSTFEGGITLRDVASGVSWILKEPTSPPKSNLPADFMLSPYFLVYSPDGKILAGLRTESNEGEDGILLWDVATHQLLRAMGGYTGKRNPAFSPDGSRLACFSTDDNNVEVWDIASGVLLYSLPVDDNPYYLAFSADGTRLILINNRFNNETLLVWDLGTGQAIHNIPIRFMSAGFSLQADLLAVEHDDTIEIWNTATGILERTLSGHTAEIYPVMLSPDGSRLASGDHSGAIYLWDTQTGERLAELIGHSDVIDYLQFSPDGKTLLSGSWDGTLRFWDVSGK